MIGTASTLIVPDIKKRDEIATLPIFNPTNLQVTEFLNKKKLINLGTMISSLLDSLS